MSSHSQFKRINILQELEQAIKKKTHEKYKSKSKTKPIQIKPAKIPVLEKPPVVGITRKSTQAVQQPAKTKCVDFKVKKYQNKKFDKVVSLINYTITSADKALKYVNLTSNFEAEFAYKLYLSDRENLMNELNNLNLQEIVSSISPLGNNPQSVEMKALQTNQYSNIEIHSLKNENDKLKKEIMIMQGEMKKFKQRELQVKKNISSPVKTKADQQKQDVLKKQIDVKQIQVNKLSDLLKRICNFTEAYDYLDLVEKEMKYRSVLASAGVIGYELTRIQREDLERNIISIDGKISELEGLMINKMEKLAQGEDEQVLEQLESINKLLHRKIAPILKENQSQSLQNKKISEIILMYVNYSIKKERELTASNEKMEGKLIDYIQMAKQFEKKDSSNGQKFQQITKENQLLKTNLKDIYEELKGLLSENLKKNGYANLSDVTFETLLKEIQMLMMKSNDVKILEKKVKQLSQEDNRKNTLASKQKSIIEKMQFELSEIKTHLQDSENSKRQVQEYVLLLQKKKKQEEKIYDDFRMNFEHLQKELQQSECLVEEKQVIIKRLQDQMGQLKSNIQKLSAMLGRKDHEITEREDIIHEKQSNMEKLLHQNNDLREEVRQLKSNLQIEEQEKNKILEHLRFMEDRLKESEGHVEAITEESNEKCAELHHEIERLENFVKSIEEQKNRFESMYINILETNKSQEARRMRTIDQLQKQNQSLREHNKQLTQIQHAMQQKMYHLSEETQEMQSTLTRSHEAQKQHLLQQISTLQQQLHQLRQYNMKQMNQELESKVKMIQKLEGKIGAYDEYQLKMESQLRELASQLEEKDEEIERKKANEEYMVQQLQTLHQQLQHLQQQQSVASSPQKSLIDSLAYDQQIKIQQLQEKLNQKSTELDHKNEYIQGLKNQLSSKLSQFEILQGKVHQMQKKIEENQARENEIDKQKQKEQQNLAMRQQQLVEKSEQIEQKIQSLIQKHQQLQDRQADLDQRDQQLQQKYEEISHKLQELKSKQAYIAQSLHIQDSKIAELREKEIGIEQQLANIERVGKEIEWKVNEVNVREEQVQNKLFEIEKKGQQLVERQHQLQYKQKQLQYKQKQLLEKQKQLLEKQKQLQEYQQQSRNEQQQQKQALIQRCQVLFQHVETLTNESNQLNQQIQTLTNNLNTTEQNLSIKDKQLHLLTNELAHAQKLIQSIRQQEQQARTEIVDLKRIIQHNQKQESNQQLQEQDKQAQQKSQQLIKSIEKVTKQYNNNQSLQSSPIVKLPTMNSAQRNDDEQEVDQYEQQYQPQQQEEHNDEENYYIEQKDNSSLEQSKQHQHIPQPLATTTTTIQLIQSKYKKLIIDLKQQLSQAQSQYTQIQQSHEHLEYKNNQLISHIENIEREKYQILTQVQNFKELTTIKIQQNDRLNQIIIQMKQQAQLERKKFNKEIQDYEELHLAPLEQQLRQKQHQIQKLQEEYYQLQYKNNAKDQYIGELENQSIRKQQQYTRKISQISDIAEQHRVRCQQLQQQNIQLKQNYAQLESKLQQLSRLNQHHSKTITSLTTQLSLLKQQNQLITTNASTFQLTSEIELRKLKYETTALTTEIQTLNDQIFYLKKQLNDKKVEEERRKDELLVQSNEVVEELKEKIRQNEEMLGETNALLQQSQNTIHSLQHKLQQQSTINAYLEQKIQHLNQHIIQLQSQIQSIELQRDSQNDKNNSLLKDKDTELMQKDIILVKNEQRIHELEYKLREKDQRIQELLAEMERLREELVIEKQKVKEQKKEQQQQSQQEQVDNEIGEFADVKSEKMNASMLSDQQEQQHSQQQQQEEQYLKSSQQKQLHEAKFQSFLARNLNPHLHTSEQPSKEHQPQPQQQQQQQQSSQLQKVEHQIIQHHHLPEQDFFDEFDQMNGKKIDDSMISNDATQQRGESYFEKEVKIIDQQYINGDKKDKLLVKSNAHQQEQEEDYSKDVEQQQQQYQQDQEQVKQNKEIVLRKSSLRKSQNLVDANQDRQHSEGSYSGERAIEHQFQSQHEEQSKQQQHQQKEQQFHNERTFDEFAEMGQYQMSASMVSNQPQPTQQHELSQHPTLHSTLHSNLIQCHEQRQHSQGSAVLYNQPPIMSLSQSQQLQTHFKSQKAIPVTPQKQLQEQQYQQYKQQGMQFDEFDEMKSEQMNASMMSDVPEPPQVEEILKGSRELDREELIHPHKLEEHSLGAKSEEQQSFSQQQQHDKQCHIELEQNELKYQPDQFCEIRSQNMNASMLSNQPQPTESINPLHSSIHNKVPQHLNIVSAHEDIQHSQGSQVHQYLIENNDSKSLDIEPDTLMHKEKQSQQALEFNEFEQIKQQKIDDFALSNQKEREFLDRNFVPTLQRNIVSANQEKEHSEQNRNQDQDYYQGSQEQESIDDVQLHRRPSSQQNSSHHLNDQQRQQRQYYDQDLEFDEFNDNKFQKMNASMLSNQPEASQKPPINQPSQSDEQQHLYNSHVFEHNLVTVSRVLQSSKKDDLDGYIHDGRSERGNANVRLDEDIESDEEKDVVDMQKKKNIMIATQYHQYRSEFEFGSGQMVEKRDEDFPMERETNVKQSQSIASNQVEINDIGGNFINCYALQHGKYNKIQKNLLLQSHNQCEERSERNLQMQWSQSSDKINHLEDIGEQEEKQYHHVARSQYAYTSHINMKRNVLDEGEMEQEKQKSISMIEANDEEEERDDSQNNGQLKSGEYEYEYEEKQEAKQQLQEDSDQKYLEESGLEQQKMEASDVKVQQQQPQPQESHQQQLHNQLPSQSHQEQQQQQYQQEVSKQQSSYYSQHGDNHHHLSHQILSSQAQNIDSSIKRSPNNQDKQSQYQQQQQQQSQKMFANISGMQFQLDENLVKDISPYYDNQPYQYQQQQQQQPNKQYNSQLLEDMEDENEIATRHHLQIEEDQEQKIKQQQSSERMLDLHIVIDKVVQQGDIQDEEKHYEEQLDKQQQYHYQDQGYGDDFQVSYHDEEEDYQVDGQHKTQHYSESQQNQEQQEEGEKYDQKEERIKFQIQKYLSANQEERHQLKQQILVTRSPEEKLSLLRNHQQLQQDQQQQENVSGDDYQPDKQEKEKKEDHQNQQGQYQDEHEQQPQKSPNEQYSQLQSQEEDSDFLNQQKLHQLQQQVQQQQDKSQQQRKSHQEQQENQSYQQHVSYHSSQEQYPSNEQNNFSNFNDMTSQKMDASMMSKNDEEQYLRNNTQEEHHAEDIQNISDFNDFKSENFGDSILSHTHNAELETEPHHQHQSSYFSQHDSAHQISQIKKPQYTEPQHISPEKSKQSQGNEFDAFNSMTEQKIDGSIMSQMLQDNTNKEFDAFNSMTEQKMDGSMMSQNDDKHLDWFGNEEEANNKQIQELPSRNQHSEEQNQQQGFSDFKDYESQHMSESHSQVYTHEQQYRIQSSHYNPNKQNQLLKLNYLQQKQQHHSEDGEEENILPVDILLTSERRREQQRERQQQEEEENYNSLLQFLPSTRKKHNKPPSTDNNNNELQDVDIQGKDTNRSNSFNQDDFEFKVRKSVQSIGSKMDIFENFNANSGRAYSEQVEFKRSQVIKTQEKIKTLKGQSTFTFSQVLEYENESSYQQYSHQKTDNDFDQFMIQSNMPAPSPVNKISGNDIFDFENATTTEDKKESKKEEKDYFDYFA